MSRWERNYAHEGEPGQKLIGWLLISDHVADFGSVDIRGKTYIACGYDGKRRLGVFDTAASAKKCVKKAERDILKSRKWCDNCRTCGDKIPKKQIQLIKEFK